ncbi:hypothetical protein IKF73_02505 [Candidatus Saccharibacteria bacterium]|nr:hypothetical protein [Candidatus Saccharibacteria bacterium]
MEQSIVINDHEDTSAVQPQEERAGLGGPDRKSTAGIDGLPDELRQRIDGLKEEIGRLETAPLEVFESNYGEKMWRALLDKISELRPSGDLSDEAKQTLFDEQSKCFKNFTEAVNAAERRYVGAKILKLTERRNQLSRQQEKASRPLARLISPEKLGILKQELARIDIELEQLRAEVGASTEQVPEFGGAVPTKAEQGKPEQPPQAA